MKTVFGLFLLVFLYSASSVVYPASAVPENDFMAEIEDSGLLPSSTPAPRRPPMEEIWRLEAGEEGERRPPDDEYQLELDIDVFIFPNQEDLETGAVQWTAQDRNGRPFQRINAPRGVVGFRVPASQTYVSGRYGNMRYMDVTLIANKPGPIGRTRLGAMFNINQNSLAITQRIYFGDEDLAWTHSHGLPLSGELLIDDATFNLDMGDETPPAVELQMRSYDMTSHLLYSRNPIVDYVESLLRNRQMSNSPSLSSEASGSCDEGGCFWDDYMQSTDDDEVDGAMSVVDYSSEFSDSVNSSSLFEGQTRESWLPEISNTEGLAITILATFLFLDPSGFSESSYTYEYVHAYSLTE